MSWPNYQYPKLPAASPAIASDLLTRLKECGEQAHATLEVLPKEIVREYLPALRQLQATIERLSK